MPVESATHISELNAANPPGTDLAKQGAAHIRLIKEVMIDSLWTARSFTLSGAVLGTDAGKTLYGDTTAGAVTLTLPVTGGLWAGWYTDIMKVNAGVNPIFIAPNSGTIQSGDLAGLAKTRRAIPGKITRVTWTGTAWIASRVESVPVGSVLSGARNGLPVGYEYPNGQTLVSASTNYPDFFAIGGSGVTPDMRGRNEIGQDTLGIAGAGRVTTAGSGIDGNTLLAAGGAQTKTILRANLPNVSPNITVADQHVHEYLDSAVVAGAFGGSSGSLAPSDIARFTALNALGSITATIEALGSGIAMEIMPPSIIMNKWLVVE